MVTTTVTERALFRRIDLKLQLKGQMLHKSPATYIRGHGPYIDNDIGEFYIVSIEQNAIAATHVDLVVLGRKLGVLKNNEQVKSGCGWSIPSIRTKKLG